MGSETQDFSPPARNDSCSSRLRLEMAAVSPALQGRQPLPAPKPLFPTKLDSNLLNEVFSL